MAAQHIAGMLDGIYGHHLLNIQYNQMVTSGMDASSGHHFPRITGAGTLSWRFFAGSWSMAAIQAPFTSPG
jgi:hypothetical protein